MMLALLGLGLQASLCFAADPVASPPASQVLWYDQPAGNWEAEALPIGNGRLGAMIFGAADRKRFNSTRTACGWATKRTRACIRISESSRWHCRGPSP